MKKFNYLLKNASMTTRIIAAIALVLGIVFIAMTCIGANSALNGAFTEIPLIDLVIDEEDRRLFEEETKNWAQELDRYLEEGNYTEEDLKEFEEEFGLSIEEVKEALYPVSLNSINLLAKANGVEDADFEALLNMILVVIKGYAGVIVLILALAVFFMKKGLVLTAYIVSIPFYLALAGGTAFAIVTVATVAYFVLMTLVNKEYKKFMSTPIVEASNVESSNVENSIVKNYFE